MTGRTEKRLHVKSIRKHLKIQFDRTERCKRTAGDSTKSQHIPDGRKPYLDTTAQCVTWALVYIVSTPVMSPIVTFSGDIGNSRVTTSGDYLMRRFKRAHVLLDRKEF